MIHKNPFQQLRWIFVFLCVYLYSLNLLFSFTPPAHSTSVSLPASDIVKSESD